MLDLGLWEQAANILFAADSAPTDLQILQARYFLLNNDFKLAESVLAEVRFAYDLNCDFMHLTENTTYPVKTRLHEDKLRSTIEPFLSCGKLNFTEPAICGGTKCFVRVNDQPHIGYTVSRVKFRTYFNKMSVAHILAKELKAKYGIQHLLLEPPQVVHNTSDCVMEALANPDNQCHAIHPGIAKPIKYGTHDYPRKAR